MKKDWKAQIWTSSWPTKCCWYILCPPCLFVICSSGCSNLPWTIDLPPQIIWKPVQNLKMKKKRITLVQQPTTMPHFIDILPLSNIFKCEISQPLKFELFTLTNPNIKLTDFFLCIALNPKRPQRSKLETILEQENAIRMFFTLDAFRWCISVGHCSGRNNWPTFSN